MKLCRSSIDRFSPYRNSLVFEETVTIKTGYRFVHSEVPFDSFSYLYGYTSKSLSYSVLFVDWCKHTKDNVQPSQIFWMFSIYLNNLYLTELSELKIIPITWWTVNQRNSNQNMQNGKCSNEMKKSSCGDIF